MPSAAHNPNLSRRLLPGILARLLAPLVKPILFCLQREEKSQSPLVVFESYMVGDLFMALSALKFLNKSAVRSGRGPIEVLCRPDCVEILQREGLVGIPFANPFFLRAGVGSFVHTWRSAWSLRKRLGPEALDLNADPRTAFWLKLAGVGTVMSYRRDSSVLFDETFPLSEPSVHQADKNMRVVETWIKMRSGHEHPTQGDFSSPPTSNAQHPTSPATWIISLWTRKAEKNWPLEQWDLFLEKMVAEKIPFSILEAPDGDKAFLDFCKRWNEKAPILRGTLLEITENVHGSLGVIATDNFLGHMAGYYNKSVLWINMSSPAEQVTPRGPRTIAVHRPSVEKVWQAFEDLRR